MKIRTKIPLLMISFILLTFITVTVILSFQHYKSASELVHGSMNILNSGLTPLADSYLRGNQNSYTALKKSLNHLSHAEGMVYVVLYDKEHKLITGSFLNRTDRIVRSWRKINRYSMPQIKDGILSTTLWPKNITHFDVYTDRAAIQHGIKSSLKTFWENLYFALPFGEHPRHRIPILSRITPVKEFGKGKTMGYIESGISRLYLRHMVTSQLKSLIIPGILIFAIMITLSILFTFNMIMAISRLSNGAQKLGEGELSYRIKMNRKDELGAWAGIFNRMAGKLADSMLTLKEKLEETRRLFKLATEDGLTKAYVHRYLMELLDNEVKRSAHTKKHLSVIMTDIDHFKKFNDTYGHQAGDYVLQQVAGVLMNNVRSDTDVVGRYGGEEFAIILPGSDQATAIGIAENLRIAVEKNKYKYKKDEFSVTISLGVSTILAGNADGKTMIKWADQALYQSKDQGRNRTSFFSRT